MKKILALVLALSLMGCATHRPTATEAAVFDVATTAAVLGSGAGVEVNPIGFVGSTALKVAVLANKDNMTPEQQQAVEHYGGALWTGAAVNNVAVFAGIPFALPLGIITAILLLCN